MNSTLLKALLVLVVVSVLFIWTLVTFRSKRNSKLLLLQLIGSTFLIIVAIVHIFEAEKWFEFMHWGSPHSIGHYLDLSSAIFGIVLFSTSLIFSKLLRK